MEVGGIVVKDAIDRMRRNQRKSECVKDRKTRILEAMCGMMSYNASQWRELAREVTVVSWVHGFRSLRLGRGGTGWIGHRTLKITCGHSIVPIRSRRKTLLHLLT